MIGCGKRIKPEQCCAWRYVGLTTRVRILCFDCRAALTRRTLRTYRQGRAWFPGREDGLTCGEVIEKGG